MVKLIRKNKSGSLELDEIGKLILGMILLLILIYIIGYVIRGEFSGQEDKIKDTFSAIR